jgi:phospho-N-acetylmuramoyl-pentapeptide-transferase
VKSVLVAALTSLLVALLVTPAVIALFRRQGYGQEIREEGPKSHQSKRGTPTMGGSVIILATLLGYLIAHLVRETGPTASGLLILMTMTGLGLVGFLDDYLKIRNQRNLGLSKTAKLVGQATVAVLFAVLARHFRSGALDHLHPASTHISFIHDSTIGLGLFGFIVWAYLMISGTSNGVNLTDGLDGLATGVSAMVFGAYVIIAFWQFGNQCGVVRTTCYLVRDPLDIAVVAAAAMGACFGFLWWNAPPAKIFMGDTGSLALGGAFATIAMTTRTELLFVVLGGLFVAVTISVIVQIAVFRTTGKRAFRMAPLQHHFELAGWQEVTIVIRFWILAGLAVAFGLGLFYAEYLTHGPLA